MDRCGVGFRPRTMVPQRNSAPSRIVAGIFTYASAIMLPNHVTASQLSVRWRSVLNTLAVVTLMLMAVFAVLRGWVVLSESIEFQSRATTPLQTPMWIPQSMWFTGWLLFAVVSVYMAAHCLWLVAQGRHDTVNALYGPQTLDEEIESEAGEVLAQTRKAAEDAAKPGASK